MPSSSAKQHRLMAAVAHNPGFAKKVGIPQRVGQHFSDADKGKKFNQGGEMKHANELHGKAKETKAIAKEEMKALKRGHAPKAIMEHEKSEHKAMGYKRGGSVETPKKGFAMGKGMGHGRKAPHSSKGEEGDTKLKGFGMGKGTGKGRSVTRAKAPKEETKQKGFAMKKGGHVKHMKKGGKSRGVAPAMPGLPGGLASALGGMGGSPMGASGASPMPQPGMKKGGHVAHHAHHGHGHQIHHHHHYAKGGSVRAGIDEKAERGHTRGKQVKMASGGHVGSHPSRRADGMASKGHTRCKVV